MKKAISITLDKKLVDQLKRLAKQESLSLSVLIERIIKGKEKGYEKLHL